MEPIDIGLCRHRRHAGAGAWLGMRVAFAAGLAGFVGLVWLLLERSSITIPARFGKALEIVAVRKRPG